MLKYRKYKKVGFINVAQAKNNKNNNLEEVFSFFNELNIISQLSTALFEQRLPDGLTTSQFSVLNWFVRVDDEATPGRLAKAFQVTGGAMTNTLKKLEAKGFIKVEQDASSARQKRVTITKAGLASRQRAIESSMPLMAEFAGDFSPEKISRIRRQLVPIREYLDEYRYKNET